MASNMDNLFIVDCSVLVPEEDSEDDNLETDGSENEDSGDEDSETTDSEDDESEDDDLEGNDSENHDLDKSENNEGSPATCSQKFLAVIAPSKIGRIKVQDEKNIRSRQFEFFIKKQSLNLCDNPITIVNSFDELKLELTRYFGTVDIGDLPTVVFLGHGLKDGQLCFQRGGTPAKEVLKAVQKCFHDKRPKEMPAHQCRVVFTQCHAHKVDRKNKRGKVHAADGKDGIEYIYFTSTKARRTHTIVVKESNSIDEQFHHGITSDKVYFKPDRNIPRIKRKVKDMKSKVLSETSALEKKLKQMKANCDETTKLKQELEQKLEQMKASCDEATKLKQELEQKLEQMKASCDEATKLKKEINTLETLTNEKTRCEYLLDGPPRHLNANILKYVLKWRKEQLKMFLQITVQHPPSSDPPNIETLKWLTEDKDGFVVEREEVQSRVDFKQKIGYFLAGPAKKIIMPIILVAGNIVPHEQSSGLKLVFSDHPDGVPIIDLFSEHVTTTAGRRNPRILFVGPGTHSGNAVAPVFQNKQLQLYRHNVTGDGPKNKIAKGDPATDVDSTRDVDGPL